MVIAEHKLQLAGLEEMLNQLNLLRQSEEYDSDVLAPTPDSIARMRSFLEGASHLLRNAFPPGTLYADGVGGLRLEWIRPERELRLVISASTQGRSYLYYEAGADYGADYAPSADKLGSRLNWLENFGGKPPCLKIPHPLSPLL